MSEPIRYQGFTGLTFRQLDARRGLAKGSAFRAFKRARPGLVEGRDFLWLDGVEHAELLQELHRAQQIYPGTVNLTLLAPETCSRLGL